MSPRTVLSKFLILSILAGALVGCGSDSRPQSPVVATPGDLVAAPPTPVALDDDGGNDDHGRSDTAALDTAARAAFDRDTGLVRRRFNVGAGGLRIDTVIDIAWTDGVGRITSRLDYDRRLEADPAAAKVLAELEAEMIDVTVRDDELEFNLEGSAEAMAALWSDVDVGPDPSGQWTTEVVAPATPGRLDVVVADGLIVEAERTFAGFGLDITSGDRWDVLE